MQRFLFAIVLVGLGVVGLGFYLGWFHFDSNKADGKSNVTLSVDTDKINQDRKTAVASVQDAGRQLKDSVVGPSEQSLDGTFVSISDGKLTMTGKDGKEHSHTLPATVKVTCDGKDCTAADLKAGMRLRVTADTKDRHAAARIEALDKDVAFASKMHDGKVVSITADKLVMTNSVGEAEQTHMLTAAVKVTCDGKDCKATDLKPGMKIRLTTEPADPKLVTRIEALDMKLDFNKDA